MCPENTCTTCYQNNTDDGDCLHLTCMLASESCHKYLASLSSEAGGSEQSEVEWMISLVGVTSLTLLVWQLRVHLACRKPARVS